MSSFTQRILRMNKMYDLPVHDSPTDLGLARVLAFQETIDEEIGELDEVASLNSLPIERLTGLADLLADVVVYCYSEAQRWGIPLDSVLEIVMDSNESKLGADGQPIHDAKGKFLKGPNYWPPEDKIRNLLLREIRRNQSYD